MLLDVALAGNIKHSQLGRSPFQSDTQLCPKGSQDWNCDVASLTPKCGVLLEITPTNIVTVGDRVNAPRPYGKVCSILMNLEPKPP